MRIKLNAIVTLAVLSCCGCSRTEVDSDVTKLQGEWAIVQVDNDGNEAKLPGLRWVVEGTMIKGIVPDGSISNGHFRIDSNKTPKAIDIVSSDEVSMASPAIYTLDGDKLRICYREPDCAEKDRPNEFAKGRGLGNMELHRMTR